MSETRPNPSYTVRRADVAAEAEEILGLWRATYPDVDPAAALRKLESQYLYAPAGPGICFFLEHGDNREAVGVQCMGPRKFTYGGRAVTAGIMADYVVDTRHRSLGPALTLLKSTMSAGHAAFAFLYGFPNPRSGVVFRRAGMRSPGAITRFVCLLRSKSFLARRFGPRWRWLAPVAAGFGDTLLAVGNALRRVRLARQWRWGEQEDFDGFFDQCWQAGRRDNWLIAERSRETLSWRFPEGTTRRISVATERVSGMQVGYIVWRRDGDAWEILDVFCRRPEEQLAGLLAGFSDRAHRLGAQSVGLEFAAPDNLKAAVQKAGFHARDQHPLFLSAEAGAEINSLPLESMYLTGFDSD